MEPNPINVQSSGKLFSLHDISLEICEITIEPLGQFFWISGHHCTIVDFRELKGGFSQIRGFWNWACHFLQYRICSNLWFIDQIRRNILSSVHIISVNGYADHPG